MYHHFLSNAVVQIYGTIILIILTASILIPVLSYDVYEYCWMHQQGWVGGISKNEVIKAANDSINAGIKRKLFKAQREQDTWNVEFDLLDLQGKQITRKMIFVDARSGEVLHSGENRIKLTITKDGVPVNNANIFVGALWDGKDDDPYKYQANIVDYYMGDERGDATIWVLNNGIRTLHIIDQNHNEYSFKVPEEPKDSYNIELEKLN